MLLIEYFMEWGENMANKRGRKGIYETRVEPYFEKIKTWVKFKVSEKQIAEYLGIGQSTFEKFKKEHPELIELIEQAYHERTMEIVDHKEALSKASKGYYYEEEKTFIEAGEDGVLKKKKEIYKKYAQPNPVASKEMLDILDDSYIGRRANHKLKVQELDLKIEAAKREISSWEAVEDDAT